MQIRLWKLLLGPLLALLVWLMPSPLESNVHCLLGILIWIVVWWLTEAIPLAATALLAPILLVIFSVCSAKDAFAPFAHPIIFLFLGGFIIARSMAVHGLDKRIALFLISRPTVHGDGWLSIVALMISAAVLSMWISNTASAAMFLPITLGMVDVLAKQHPSSASPTLLGVAYACSLGGLMTPIGSPPNVIAIGMLSDIAKIDISFVDWFVVGFPVAVLTLISLVLILRPKLKPHLSSFDSQLVLRQYQSLGKMSAGEQATLACLLLAVTLWVFPAVLALLWGKENTVYLWLRSHFPDAVVALGCALLLFLVPTKKGPVLNWKQAIEIDWGALLLFGGGLALGAQMFETGLAKVMGEYLIAFTGAQNSPWFFVIVSVYFAIFLTETTSNTASANLLVPLMIAGAQSLGLDPAVPTLGVALACSMAFMLPVATPPNAIFYGSTKVSAEQMRKMGFMLNLLGGAIILLVLYSRHLLSSAPF